MRDRATRPMPAPSRGDGPAAWRVDVASMEVLPDRGLADAVAGPPVAVGEAAAAEGDAGTLVDGDGAASAGARITAGAPPAGAGDAADGPGPGTAGTAGAGTAGAGTAGAGADGVVGCGVPGAGGATGCGAIVRLGDGVGVRLGSGSSGSSEPVGWGEGLEGEGVGVFDGPSSPLTRPSRSMDSVPVAAGTAALTPAAACEAGAPADRASTTASAAAAVPRRSPPW